jgi:hypothetical protein
VSVADKGSADLTLLVKHIFHHAEIDVPLESPCQDRSISKNRNRHCQIQHISVDHRNKIVVFAHNAICNVMGIHSLLRKEAVKSRCD